MSPLTVPANNRFRSRWTRRSSHTRSRRGKQRSLISNEGPYRCGRIRSVLPKNATFREHPVTLVISLRQEGIPTR
jgi:hypothetical protein